MYNVCWSKIKPASSVSGALPGPRSPQCSGRDRETAASSGVSCAGLPTWLSVRPDLHIMADGNYSQVTIDPGVCNL